MHISNWLIAGALLAALAASPASAQQVCGGLLGQPCADGTYCNFPADANCGMADATGTCEKRPEICTQEYNPVCGCNGETYGNACEAAAAGTSVASVGACTTEAPPRGVTTPRPKPSP